MIRMMNSNTLSKIVIFAAGAVVGSAVTFKLVKDKYEKIAREEIDSVIETFSKSSDRKTDDMSDDNEDEDESEDYSNERKQLSKLISEQKYDNYEEEEDEDDMGKPYVISPEEFGEYDYPMVTLFYYADGVVTNERGKIVSNVDELIGDDFASHYGEYETDTVFVRNDKMKIDYEILKDYRNYSEIS